MHKAWLLLAAPLAAAPFAIRPPVLEADVEAMLARAKVGFEKGKDSSGDTMFTLKMDGYSAALMLYMVEEGKPEIARLSWVTSFDLKEGIKPEAVNEWNSGNLDVKVYRDDEGDPVLEAGHTVEGGVDAANLDAWLRDVVEEAGTFVAEHGSGAGQKPLR